LPIDPRRERLHGLEDCGKVACGRKTNLEESERFEGTWKARYAVQGKILAEWQA
jgi:hypothetical protein